MFPKAYPDQVSRLLLFTRRAFFARAATFFMLVLCRDGGVVWGNLLYRPWAGPGTSRRVRILWLTNSYFLLALKAYFCHTGIIIFLLLTVTEFSAGSRSNSK